MIILYAIIIVVICALAIRYFGDTIVLMIKIAMVVTLAFLMYQGGKLLVWSVKMGAKVLARLTVILFGLLVEGIRGLDRKMKDPKTRERIRNNILNCTTGIKEKIEVMKKEGIAKVDLGKTGVMDKRDILGALNRIEKEEKVEVERIQRQVRINNGIEQEHQVRQEPVHNDKVNDIVMEPKEQPKNKLGKSFDEMIHTTK